MDDFTNTSITTFQKDGKWFLAEFKVNPFTGKVGEMKTTEVGPSRDLMIERFKIRVVELGLI